MTTKEEKLKKLLESNDIKHHTAEQTTGKDGLLLLMKKIIGNSISAEMDLLRNIQ